MGSLRKGDRVRVIKVINPGIGPSVQINEGKEGVVLDVNYWGVDVRFYKVAGKPEHVELHIKEKDGHLEKI